LLLMGTSTALVCAYLIRFMAISIGGIEAGLSRIPPSLEQASRLLGETSTGTLRRIHLPLLRPALGAAALLVFVDTMKELPATLLLRPVNFETLATWLYAEAARGTYEEGAVAALAIVIAGLLPVILLARAQLKSTHSSPTCLNCLNWIIFRWPTALSRACCRLYETCPCRWNKAAQVACWAHRAAAKPLCCVPLPGLNPCVQDQS